MTPFTFQSGTIVNLDHVQRIVFDDEPQKGQPFRIGFIFETDPVRAVWDNYATRSLFEKTRKELQNIGKLPEIKLNNHYIDNPCSVYNP